jgi:hypothetical protein
MWTIERREEGQGARATRWVPLPGVRYGTQEEAAGAVREAVVREGREGTGPTPFRSHRYRVAIVAAVCAVIQ